MVPEGERPDLPSMIRAQARLDAEMLVPRPGYPILGLAAPELTPALVSGYQTFNGEWTVITLEYGPLETTDGSRVAVTSLAVDAEMLASPPAFSGADAEAELRDAVARELVRAPEADQAEPAVITRELLPAGEALVCRQGGVWAMRLLADEEHVTVTVVGRNVEPQAVRLARVPDLRPMIEARAAATLERIERHRGQPRPPLPDLPPAEGVAAFLALAEFILARQAEIREAVRARRSPRGHSPDAGDGRMFSALWQRAVREQQRIAGVDARVADAMVTSVINHLGHLAEHAGWFGDDERLRAAAIDETLRHAVLRDMVASDPAQRAWARYWGAHLAGLGHAGPVSDMVDEMEARQAIQDGWLAAWASWAEDSLPA
jgi:hypothetical protein